MTSRTKKLETLFEGFHTVRLGMLFSKILQSATTITPSQWMVLHLIEQHTHASVKYIAGQIGISSSATTQLIDGLVRKVYVVRKEKVADRRLVELELSAKARRDIGRLQKKIVMQMSTVFKTLNDTEFDQYVTLNQKIVTHIQNKL